ncbi:MAG TPA: hypothetical protein VKA09_08715 [Nitrososphaeraceae archaeon]|jgi:hypothetical protein|nr:hypothetical protein [Nitrososphaeraceae archaeon]
MLLKIQNVISTASLHQHIDARSGGLEPITVTQNFGEGNVEKTVRPFDFDS